MTTDPVHIAVCFDRGMSVPFVVCAESLRRSMRKIARKVVIHAIHIDAIPDDVKKTIRPNTSKFEIRFVAFQAALTQFSVSRHVTHATYARLKLPDLLPDLDRVLYLDVDLLALRPIGALFDSDLKGHPLGACNDFALTIYAAQTGLQVDPTSGVTESGGTDVSRYLQDTVGLTLGQERRYFNAGVLVIDLKAWRERGIADKVIETALAHPEFVFHDQDALNAVLWADYQELDHRWNAAASCANVEYLKTSGAVELAVAKDWSVDPYIVHYAGSSKPWNPRGYATVYDALFWRFARQARIYDLAIALMPRDLRYTAKNRDGRSRFLARVRRWLSA